MINKHPIDILFEHSRNLGHTAVTTALYENLARRHNLRITKQDIDRRIADGSVMLLGGRNRSIADAISGRIEASIAAWIVSRAHGTPCPAGEPINDCGASQGHAWRTFAGHGTLLLTGGPGTGKTWLLSRIIASLLRQGLTVLCACPTGKAATVLGGKTEARVMTIHKLIELIPGNTPGRHRYKPIEADVVVIDESSMIDSSLMAWLIDAIPSSTHVIFSGDKDQIAPVGAGQPFRDMLECGKLPVAELKENYRQAAGSGIPTFAKSILSNNVRPSLDHIRTNEGVFAWSIDEERLVEKAVSYMQKAEGRQVLSPVRNVKFSASSTEINRQISEYLFPGVKRVGGKCVGDRVIFNYTSYQQGFVNGDIGVIESIRPFVVRTSSGITVSMNEEAGESVSDIEQAYCLTAHKGQGSEYDDVLIILTQEARHMYTRNLLYTAVTRARKSVTLIGDITLVKQAAMRSNYRNTCIQYFLDNPLRSEEPADLSLAWELLS